MSLKVTMVLSKNYVSLPVTPNEKPLSHIIATYS